MLLLMHLFVALATARAHVHDCAHLVVSDRERLAAALAHTLATDERTGSDEHFVRLDRDIVDWASARMAKLSPGQRENVFHVLETSLLGSRFDHGLESEVEFLEDAHAELQGDDHGFYLVTDALESQSEASRFSVRHELSHLFRFVQAGPLEQTFRRAERLLGRPLGLFLEEAYAAREDYGYLRRNYSELDLPRLAERAAPVQALVNEAAARGFLLVDDEGRFEVDFARIRSAEDQFLLFQVTTRGRHASPLPRTSVAGVVGARIRAGPSGALPVTRPDRATLNAAAGLGPNPFESLLVEREAWRRSRPNKSRASGRSRPIPSG